MRIVHITESHEAKAGGIPVVVDQLARHSVQMGLDVEILSVGRDPLPPPVGATLTNVRPQAPGRRWGWSLRLGDKVRSLVQRNGSRLLHLHGAWLAPQWYAARAARETGVPFILSLHGQLQPCLWRDKGAFHFAKKQIYWHSVAYPALRWASVIQAMTPLEKAHLAALFPGQRIELIANAVDLDEIDAALREAYSPRMPRSPVVGFLGRLHPVKGAHLLVEAFSIAGLPREWKLALAGPPGGPAYMSHLAGLVARSKVRERIRIVGPLMGSDKWGFYQSVAVVAVPSLSEVVGLVNLEAAACGTPTITTLETGLDDWERGGGLLIRPTAEELAAALWKICSESTHEYQARSTASRRLVEERYSWAVVGPRWRALYDSLVG